MEKSLIIPVGPNVLIERLPANDGFFGPWVNISNFHEKYNMDSIIGRVVAIPEHRPSFMGKEREALRAKDPEMMTLWPLNDLIESLALREDVPMEVNVGDVVMFHYRYNLIGAEGHERVDDGLFLVHYSDLWVKINPDGRLYPLNGLVVVFPDDAKDHSVAVARRLLRSRLETTDKWIVAEEGSLVQSRYADGASADADYHHWPTLRSKRVLIDPRLPIRIESSLFEHYAIEDSSIFVCHRQHIAAILE